jgi:hypothetical protein
MKARQLSFVVFEPQKRSSFGGGGLSFYTMAIINIHSELAEMLTEKELYLLIHIVKRAGVKGAAWPSRETLMRDTGWGSKNTLDNNLKSLIEKGIVEKTARYRADGGQTSNSYRIMTDKVGVYVPGTKLHFEPTPTQKMPISPTQKMPSPPTQKVGHEVLVNRSINTNRNKYKIIE